MTWLGRYAKPVTLANMGITDDEPSLVSIDKDYYYQTWIGYNIFRRGKRFVVASKTAHKTNRTVWFAHAYDAPEDEADEGIPQEERDRIFETIFHQENRVLTKDLGRRLIELGEPAAAA